ncbi:MAG TPA: hypothetical protein VLG38_04415 [Gammaproteobacteria bacterium]|nr:hypothetical protein [Gammaproteobacteria bacterium]
MRITRINVLKVFFVAFVSITSLTGCRSVNSYFGCDSSDYTKVTELPPLKFPPNAMMVSKRYDIPQIPHNNNPDITTYAPPDYNI